MKRTQDEILKRLETRKKNDMFGFEWKEYLYYLDYEHAKPYVKDNITKEGWEESTEKEPAEKIKSYMSFAWKKANDCRGISTGRSLSHMVAWLWLDGQDEFLKKWNNLEDYEYYGKPQLIAICELYEIDHKQYDNNVRTNVG